MSGARKAAPSKGRLNILIMRSKGQVSNISVSWPALVFGLVFAVLFVAASIVVFNRYFHLYPEYRDLLAAHRQMSQEFSRLRDLYAYQYAVADDYAKFLNSVGRDEEGEGGPPQPAAEDFIPTAALDPPPAAETGPEAALLTDADGFSLESWGDLFPDPAVPPEQELDIEKFKVDGSRFSFSLTNETAGLLAQGRLLMLFAVESGGRVSLAPYPEFDFKSAAPDFDLGPRYNIRSSKPVSGRLDLAGDARIMEMMVIARSKSGNIVLKKKISPVEQ